MMEELVPENNDMPKTKIIGWEKWSDPFKKVDDVDIIPLGDEEYSPYDENEMKIITKKIPVVSTQMGIVPLGEWLEPGEVFNFWVGHANFNITADIVSQIEVVEGVEILDVFTRYRFRIGIGSMFKDGTVMRKVAKCLGVKYKRRKKTDANTEES